MFSKWVKTRPKFGKVSHVYPHILNPYEYIGKLLITDDVSRYKIMLAHKPPKRLDISESLFKNKLMIVLCFAQIPN